MRNGSKSGFTLVEILIVVVILGILAAIVVPQFTNASNEAVKGALQSQLQTIDSQIELYRVQHQGALPTEDTESELGGDDNGGWGIMVGGQYLKEEPFNGYTGNSVIAEGDEPTAIAATRDADEGWYYEVTGNNIAVFAAGYDEPNNLLAHEQEEEEP